MQEPENTAQLLHSSCTIVKMGITIGGDRDVHNCTTVLFHVLRGFGGKAGRELIYKPYENNTIQHNPQQYLPALHEKYEFKQKNTKKNLHNNKNVIIFVVSLKTSSLNDKEGLKARIEELKSDLDFYLCYRTRLSKRSRRMKAVIEKEIKQLEDEISRLYELLRD